MIELSQRSRFNIRWNKWTRTKNTINNYERSLLIRLISYKRSSRSECYARRSLYFVTQDVKSNEVASFNIDAQNITHSITILTLSLLDDLNNNLKLIKYSLESLLNLFEDLFENDFEEIFDKLV